MEKRIRLTERLDQKKTALDASKANSSQVARLWRVANKATKLATRFLGEKAPVDMIEDQALEFAMLGEDAIDTALARYTETAELYEEGDNTDAHPGEELDRTAPEGEIAPVIAKTVKKADVEVKDLVNPVNNAKDLEMSLPKTTPIVDVVENPIPKEVIDCNKGNKIAAVDDDEALELDAPVVTPAPVEAPVVAEEAPVAPVVEPAAIPTITAEVPVVLTPVVAVANVGDDTLATTINPMPDPADNAKPGVGNNTQATTVNVIADPPVDAKPGVGNDTLATTINTASAEDDELTDDAGDDAIVASEDEEMDVELEEANPLDSALTAGDADVEDDLVGLFDVDSDDEKEEVAPATAKRSAKKGVQTLTQPRVLAAGKSEKLSLENLWNGAPDVSEYFK